MSLDLLNNQTEASPKTFIRGQTLEFLMELPQSIPENFFESIEGDSTVITSELRKIQQAGEGGFIANLAPVFEPNTNYTKIRFRADDTEEWPLGPAVFDVVFVRTTINPASEKKYRSLPVYITIEDGVTQ